jgi:maltooligosyltrehalose trehalohydrolase
MLGAVPTSDGLVRFGVWAPNADRVSVLGVELEPDADGVFSGVAEARAGNDYCFTLNTAMELPDPCSRSQPRGVLGPSRIVDTARFDIRPGPRVDSLVVYELHVGTFSPEGTFAGVVPRLAELAAAGVTAIELMPVATFPGNRGWGYDGLYTFAPHHAYGGPEGLARLVDAAHAAGLAVILDVVYNHIGPGSEALSSFGPYFAAANTLWGQAIDYSRRGVREWAIQNAELWTRDYRIDGLRLDAVNAIDDAGPLHVCAELKQRVGDAVVISETAPGDRRPVDEWGHDAQWDDTLHHALHAMLTGERDGYYADYCSIDDVVRALRQTEPQLVACAQNHDQVGNRALGDRLAPELDRVALSTVLFSRATPLVFMGEEYGETRPFQFFTDHIDAAIAEATREGRKQEFAAFESFGSGSELPDPQDEETFRRSKLAPQPVADWFREAVALRRSLPDDLDVEELGDHALRLRRGRHTLTVDFAALTLDYGS